jgi:L-aspartate oxidase
VSRAILQESVRSGRPVYLSLAHLDAAAVRARFPVIAELCAATGLDLATDPLPVSPAAHYLMGGVATDIDGRTSLPGLYAAGEVACTGVHGANRLASNSLLEGLVFGGRVADAMAADDRSGRGGGSAFEDPPPTRGLAAPPVAAEDIQSLMWESAGVFRDREPLAGAAERVEDAWGRVVDDARAGRNASAGGWRIRAMVIVARLILRAAIRREESRGGHWRHDFPERDDLHWKRRVSDSRAGAPLG